MGNTIPNQCRPPMKIHNLHGKYLKVSPERLTAKRVEGYADAMFFGSRTVDKEEQIELEITEMTQNWNGSLRFGFTSIDPVDINNHPEGIPRFMCPDLIKRGGSFIETLNHIKLRAGDRIVFWLSNAGEIQLKVNDTLQRPQVTKLITQPVWPAVDVYGNAVGVKFHSLKDSVVVVEKTEPEIYSLLHLGKFSVEVNSETLELINHDIVRRKVVRKAYAWNANPLPVNTVWALLVKELDYLVSKDLSIAVLTVSPSAAFTDFPETMDGFNHSTIFPKIYARMFQGDELAVCITEGGLLMAALNGKPFETIGSVPKSVNYWIVADLNCDIVSMQSVGIYQMTKYPLPKLPSITKNFASRFPSLPSQSSFADFSNLSSVASSVDVVVPADVVPAVILPPNNDSECVICLNSVPDSVFIPCGHICCCKLCADNLMNEHGNLYCPTCRKKIDSNIKVNF